MAGEVGLLERDYYKMKPREFERLYRGLLLREEREWDRMRLLISTLINVNTSKGKRYRPQDIRKLPILDSLYKTVGPKTDPEYAAKLRKFGERLIAKENGRN